MVFFFFVMSYLLWARNHEIAQHSPKPGNAISFCQNWQIYYISRFGGRGQKYTIFPVLVDCFTQTYSLPIHPTTTDRLLNQKKSGIKLQIELLYMDWIFLALILVIWHFLGLRLSSGLPLPPPPPPPKVIPLSRGYTSVSIRELLTYDWVLKVKRANI